MQTKLTLRLIFRNVIEAHWLQLHTSCTAREKPINPRQCRRLKHSGVLHVCFYILRKTVFLVQPVSKVKIPETHLQPSQSSALPKQAFNPTRTQAERQLGITQRLHILLHLFKTKGTIAKQPDRKRKCCITVQKLFDQNLQIEEKYSYLYSLGLHLIASVKNITAILKSPAPANLLPVSTGKKENITVSHMTKYSTDSG